jgi:hypothetical protein
MRETALKQPELHVREGEQRLARQNARLANLENAGYLSEAAHASDLLDLIEKRLRFTRERLARERRIAGSWS